METFYFTLVAIALYVCADWLLKWYEARIGRVLEHRSLVFFLILLVSALVTFALIRRLVA